MFPYKVRLNWVTIRNDECYRVTMQEYSKLTGVSVPHIPKPKNLVGNRVFNAFNPVKSKSNMMMSIPFPHLKETIYPRSLEMGVQYTHTQDSCKYFCD